MDVFLTPWLFNLLCFVLLVRVFLLYFSFSDSENLTAMLIAFELKNSFHISKSLCILSGLSFTTLSLTIQITLYQNKIIAILSLLEAT